MNKDLAILTFLSLTLLVCMSMAAYSMSLVENSMIVVLYYVVGISNGMAIFIIIVAWYTVWKDCTIRLKYPH